MTWVWFVTWVVGTVLLALASERWSILPAFVLVAILGGCDVWSYF